MLVLAVMVVSLLVSPYSSSGRKHSLEEEVETSPEGCNLLSQKSYFCTPGRFLGRRAMWTSPCSLEPEVNCDTFADGIIAGLTNGESGGSLISN